VVKLSSEIYNSLDGLEEISKMPKDDFLQKRHIIAGAKYYFIVAIEASIDLANHLITEQASHSRKLCRYFQNIKG
jgi:uncharacterized protein YutE (UPF0331/DUF86 family)